MTFRSSPGEEDAAAQRRRAAQRPFRVELSVSPDHAQLLAGLEAWQRLGLLSDAEVRRLCQQLVCDLPEVSVAAAPPAPPPVARQPSPIAQRLQSLRAEISVIWLLFLGVFLVIVSSGVLAASQWQNFSAIGQYSILGGYTVAFGSASVWTSRQPRLQLTTQMLRIATLLLIPINFWVMDELQLSRQPIGLASAAAAAIGFTAATVQLLRPTLATLPHRRLLLLSTTALSWLHWGWSSAGIALAATYAGAIVAAVALLDQDRLKREDAEPHPLSTPTITLAIAALLLVARALLLAVPIARLGLAVGICGWLIGWLARRSPPATPWMGLAALLLLIGWWVTVPTVPWQAIAVSGLVAVLLVDRLYRFRQAAVLGTLFFVGLQAYGLLWRLLPGTARQQILASCAQIAGETFTPFALAGVAFFPYIWLTLAFARRLRRQAPDLATQLEWLTLTLGIGLLMLSAPNPLMRSLHLIAAAATLAAVVRRRPHRRLIYFTHTIALLAIGATLDWRLPNLSPSTWAGVLLAGMGMEWGLSVAGARLGDAARIWRQSAWHLGLGLAGLSYALLLHLRFDLSPAGVMWLAVPLALTGLAVGQRAEAALPSPQLAAGLSAIALVLVQPLTLIAPMPRLIGLATATGLMLLNAPKLRSQIATLLTIGFGLGAAAALIWQGFGDRLTLAGATSLSAIAALLLWLLQRGLRRRDGLSRLYADAADWWAIGLSAAHLLLLTSYTLLASFASGTATADWLWAAALGVAAIACRPARHDLSFVGIAWGVELLVAQGLMLRGADLPELRLHLAIANLGLGLFTQILGDWWTQRQQQPYRLSWHLIPLLYALLGFGLAQGSLTLATGLYTLGLAAVAVGVGRRQPDFQPLTILGVLGVSIAAFELLLYQLLQASGGELGDGLVALAGLAVGLTVGLRQWAGWLSPLLRLPAAALTAIADLHWIAGLGMLLLALLLPLSPAGSWLWVGMMAALAIDALWQGRAQPQWTYFGIFALLAAIAHACDLLVPDSTVLLAGAGAIASGVALALHQLPWSAWGWQPHPWRRSALVVPGAVVLLTVWQISIPSLLVAAAFYAWLAKARTQVRLSYVSLLLADWALLRWLDVLNAQEPLWYASVLGASLLFVAQLDPSLRSPSEREKRHSLRSLAIGLVGLTGIYQSETSLWIAALTLVLSLAWVAAGLALRIRAFLYVGTLIFVLQILRQLWLLVSEYSLLLWAIGIVLGLAFIWTAATFEARRSQVSALMQHWIAALNAWE